ncbi:MAG: FxsA family protein [Pseudohongiellaceae bacterium]
MRLFLLLFIIVPIAEMLLLFEVSDHIGAINTVLLVMLTAVIGINVLKSQGLSTFSRASRRLNSGELPAQEMIEGLFLAVGGAFLLTPGFITDTLGFIFLIGPSRRFLVRALIRSGKLTVFSAGSSARGFTFSSHSQRPGRDDDVYEAEYTRENPPRTRLDDQDPD